MMLATHLLIGTIFLALSGISFAQGRVAVGFVLLVVGYATLVRARLRWPADQDYYLNRNFARRK